MDSIMNAFHMHCDLSATCRTVPVLVQNCLAAINLTFWCFICTPVEQAIALAAFCFQACPTVTACFLARLSCPAFMRQQLGCTRIGKMSFCNVACVFVM